MMTPPTTSQRSASNSPTLLPRCTCDAEDAAGWVELLSDAAYRCGDDEMAALLPAVRLHHRLAVAREIARLGSLDGGRAS